MRPFKDCHVIIHYRKAIPHFTLHTSDFSLYTLAPAKVRDSVLWLILRKSKGQTDVALVHHCDRLKLQEILDQDRVCIHGTVGARIRAVRGIANPGIVDQGFGRDSVALICFNRL